MGDGYYLGESKYRGWIIEKVKIYDRKGIIEIFPYVAGNHEDIILRMNVYEVKEESTTEA